MGKMMTAQLAMVAWAAAVALAMSLLAPQVFSFGWRTVMGLWLGVNCGIITYVGFSALRRVNARR